MVLNAISGEGCEFLVRIVAQANVVHWIVAQGYMSSFITWVGFATEGSAVPVSALVVHCLVRFHAGLGSQEYVARFDDAVHKLLAGQLQRVYLEGTRTPKHGQRRLYPSISAQEEVLGHDVWHLLLFGSSRRRSPCNGRFFLAPALWMEDTSDPTSPV